MAVEATRAMVPVLLLKTRSMPHDNYEDYFRSLQDGAFDPIFIPVLEHRFVEQALRGIRELIFGGAFASGEDRTYGGLVFTSQRAVEAFSFVIEEVRQEKDQDELKVLIPKDLVFYVVGPATARGLRTLALKPRILGEETGNGEALAQFMLDDYNERYPTDGSTGRHKPGLLFLVGEQRRDIIPKTLQSEVMTRAQRIAVEELVIYETGEMASFKTDFSRVWSSNLATALPMQWIVVFSPTGCGAMLDTINATNQQIGTQSMEKSASADNSTKATRTLIATIGPTTRDFLRKEFSIEPDVCAATPSPEGVADAIIAFLRNGT